MYVYGTRNIYKQTLLLPPNRGFSVKFILKKCREQRKLPPRCRDGCFKTVYRTEEHLIAIWKYYQHQRVGCSVVLSHQHENLPHPIKQTVVLEPKSTGIGLQFLYGGYIENISLDRQTKKNIVEKNEDERRDDLVDKCRSVYSSRVRDGGLMICQWGEIYDGYCNFNGGGDIMFAIGGYRFGCIAIQEQIKIGEIELKFAKTSCAALEAQLQANMNLIGSKSLLGQLEEGKNINTVTVYGLAFGVYHFFVLLQMDVNYENNTCEYKELSSAGPSPNLHLNIDAAIHYVVEKISN